MKKNLLISIVLFIFVFGTLFLGVLNENQSVDFNPSNGIINEKSSEVNKAKTNEYKIDVQFNPKEKSLIATEKVLFTNKTGEELSQIYFHLYPNAFKTKETVPVLNSLEQAFPNGFEPGYIDIFNIKKVNKQDQNLNYEILGSDSTIMRVDLETPLQAGDQIELNITFKVTIPSSVERFGYGEGFFNLGNWYPIVAMYDESGWNLDPYYAIGDPFYSDIANYDVTISVPQDYIVAASGDLMEEKMGEHQQKTYHFASKSMRDFAWVASNHFQVKEKIIDNILLKTYYIDKDEAGNQLALNAAENSLKIFNQKYGEYPYKTYSVVETNFAGGMEYPGIVFISKQYYDENYPSDYLEVVVVHETAHQWWYATVGNDQIDEAWLDEAFASYSEVIYYENNYGKKIGNNYYTQRILSSFERAKTQFASDGNDDNEVILKSVNEFKGWSDYGPLVYRKGAILLHELRSQIGDDAFFEILQNYYQRYQFKVAKTEDFIQVVEDVTNKNWDNFFDEWLYGNVNQNINKSAS